MSREKQIEKIAMVVCDELKIPKETAGLTEILSIVAREMGEKIHEIAEECGGGVMFYQRMRKFADELKKEHMEGAE